MVFGFTLVFLDISDTLLPLDSNLTTSISLSRILLLNNFSSIDYKYNSILSQNPNIFLK